MAGFHEHTFGACLAPKRVQNTGGKSDRGSCRPAQPPICPECRSSRAWKDGKRHTDAGVIQRYICRDCGYRFSASTLNNKKTKRHTLARQVCAEEGKAKNLVKVETRTEKRAAGATIDAKSLVFEFAWWLKKEGIYESTIVEYTRVIRGLIKRGADVQDPESVKAVLARIENWQESTKSTAAAIYTTFLTMHGLTWSPPKYKQRQSLPFIPTEREIDDLIANCGKITGTALKVAKETGARSGEIARVKWVDIDKERKLLRIDKPEKGSNPRILPISTGLINMLEGMPRKGDYIFTTSNRPTTSKYLAGLLWRSRKTAARKLGNPRLLEITLQTLRHWKGTMEYHQTKNLLHVKQVLGHKSIQNTMVYIHLEKSIFNEANDSFISMAVDDLEEACRLIEVGFEYVCDMAGKKIFRKRK